MVEEAEWLAHFRKHVGEPEYVRELIRDRDFLRALSKIGTTAELERVLAVMGTSEQISERRKVIEEEISRRRLRSHMTMVFAKWGKFARGMIGGALLLSTAWAAFKGDLAWLWGWLVQLGSGE